MAQACMNFIRTVIIIAKKNSVIFLCFRQHNWHPEQRLGYFRACHWGWQQKTAASRAGSNIRCATVNGITRSSITLYAATSTVTTSPAAFNDGPSHRFRSTGWAPAHHGPGDNRDRCRGSGSHQRNAGPNIARFGLSTESYLRGAYCSIYPTKTTRWQP